MARVNPHFAKEFVKYGAKDFGACYNCGTCTAICDLTDADNSFPRKMIRSTLLGLEGDIRESLEPWLCYYCGDCSESCPRLADPGNLMMAMRRYLTARYDWTGLARRFYTSHWFELVAIVIIGTLVGLLFTVFNPNGIVTELNPDGGVKINQMFPVKWVHLGDWIMAAAIASLLITNIARMWYFTVWKDKGLKIPFRLYLAEAWNLAVHFATQKSFKKCDSKKYWAAHWLLMSGYTVMFTLIVMFLPWFQTETIYHWYQPQRLLGYYATIGLIIGLVYFLVGRVRKNAETFKLSHLSDWLFIILLLLTTLTGILLHTFRINGMPVATYWMYVIHLAILVPMLVIEVPFSKWSHLAYRPFAAYFASLKKSAQGLSKQARG